MCRRCCCRYQGENNLYQCQGAHGSWGRVPGEGPTACGVAAEGTGYACAQKNLITSWRGVWNGFDHAGNTTPPLPFGVVTLAGGTDEGLPYV